MGQRSISGPLVAVVIGALVVVVGFLLYRGATGGTVGDGRAGNVEASPPMPIAAKQAMIQTARQQQGH
jgi:hypothetical protein